MRVQKDLYSLSVPRAVIKASAISSKTSPLRRSFILTVHLDVFSSHLASRALCESFIYFSAHTFPQRVPVIQNLRRRSVKGRPTWIRLERELVAMGWDICEHDSRQCSSHYESGQVIGKIPQAHPRYRLSNRVPPTSSFLS